MDSPALQLLSAKWPSSIKKYAVSLLQVISNMKELQQVHAVFAKLGLIKCPHVMCKLVHFTALSPCGSLEYARLLFDRNDTNNYFVYNTMIRSYTQNDIPEEAVRMYNLMQHKSVKPDHFTYTFVLKSCAKVCAAEDKHKDIFVKKGSELHCRIIQLGLNSDNYVQNSLMNMYSQCGRVHLARLVFDNMTERDTISWNTMILAYERCNDRISADSLLEKIPVKNVVFYNNMITQHVKLGNIDAAWRTFMNMPERDSVSWNSVISGFIQIRDYRTALSLFHQMQVKSINPTEITMILVLGACAETGELEIGKQIHIFLQQNNYKVEGIMGSALVDMYAKCGNLILAREIFYGMSLKHVICWNSMIVALAVHGYCEEALELFESMQKKNSGALPNRITFIGVLIACSHKGLIKEGLHYFSQMVNKYDIRPDIKHYGCMVDLLSRWGLLNEAYQMIKSMPFQANSVLWRTMLGACRLHKNVELAEKAMKKLGELEPFSDGDYVLLSHMYAEAGRWEAAEEVRNKMRQAGVMKKSGCSQVGTK